MREFKKFINISGHLLITGETGTGKSYLAYKIFKESKIHKNSFTCVPLSSLSESLFESELYGHVKGAFSGAINNSKGYLETASRGTLFLDEIGVLSLGNQKKLLFLLEEGHYHPVGSSIKKEFKGRIMIATRRNLLAMVEEGTFREDLYYRLLLYHLHVQPLRETKEKLKGLIRNSFEELKKKLDKNWVKMSEECFRFLLNYPWPGNIRELRNCLEFGIFSTLQSLEIKDLPEWVKNEASKLRVNPSNNKPLEKAIYKLAREDFEKDFFYKALHRFGGMINLTAKEIGISKTTLIAKIRKYDINTQKIKAYI